MSDVIYQRPADYDLEHEDDNRDVRFYRELVRRWRPLRILDLACGNGRITLELAAMADDLRFEIVGVDLAEEMLASAREKSRERGLADSHRLRLVRGDMRTWSTDEPFDLALITCSSITHLLTLDDQLSAWRRAYAALRAGGRLVVDVTMPDLRTYADSLQSPPRALLQVDRDSTDPESGRRLIRYRATSFDPFEQRALIRFFYDTFDGDSHTRYVSDFESHVYFPNELKLLFLQAGFVPEGVWADYSFRAPRPWSREIVMAGRRES
jgi:ubiquinone/menaquinone biosynthesis C-methylase UbiE